MAQQYRSRNTPIINPFDQLPTPVFDAFVEDISTAIKNALNPHSAPVTSYTRSKDSHAYSRVPAPKFFPSSSSRDSAVSDETSGIGEGVNLSHASQPTQPQLSASSYDDSMARETREGSDSVTSSHALPIVVDLVSDDSESDGEGIPDDEEVEEEESDEEEALKRAHYGAGGGDESNEVGPWASSASDASGEREAVDDTFEMHEPRVFSSFKGKARAADEGPGVRALRGISERMQSLPHQVHPVPVADEDEEEEGDSAPWVSDDDLDDRQFYGPTHSQQDDSEDEDQPLYADAGQSSDEHDSGGADESSRSGGDNDASSGDGIDHADWKAELYDSRLFSPLAAFPDHDDNQEVIASDDSPSPDLEFGECGGLHDATPIPRSALVRHFAGDRDQSIPRSAEQPHQFFSDEQEGAPQFPFAQDDSNVAEVNVQHNETNSARPLEPSFETISPQWHNNDTSAVTVDFVPLDNLVTEDEYADETGGYGPTGDSSFSQSQIQIQADSNYAFNTTVGSDVFDHDSTTPPIFRDSSVPPPPSIQSEQEMIPISVSLSVAVEPPSTFQGSVGSPMGLRSDIPLDQVSHDATRTPSPLPPSFTVWPHTRDPTPLSPTKPVNKDRTVHSSLSMQEQPSFTSATPPPANVEHSEPSTAEDIVTNGVAEPYRPSNDDFLQADRPAPTLAPPLTDLALPSIPSKIENLSDDASTNMITQPPLTPTELPVGLVAIDELLPMDVAREFSMVGELQSSSAEVPHERNQDEGTIDQDTCGQDLPDPGLPPSPTDLAIPFIPSEVKQLDSTIPSSIVVHASSSPRDTPLNDAEASHDLNPQKLATTIPSNLNVSPLDNFPTRASSDPPPAYPTVPDPRDTPPPSAMSEDQAPFSDGITPSASLLVQPPTTPRSSPATSVKTARMTSPALNAARRLPLSARIGALRRSVSGSSVAVDDAPSVFLVPHSPVSLVEAQMPLTEAALGAAGLQAEKKSNSPHRTQSLEVEPPTSVQSASASESDGIRLSLVAPMLEDAVATERTPETISSGEAVRMGDIANSSGAGGQTPVHSPDPDRPRRKSDEHAASETGVELAEQIVTRSEQPTIVHFRAADLPLESPPDDTPADEVAKEQINGEHNDEASQLKSSSEPWPKIIASESSASEVGDLLEGTTTSSVGDSQTEQVFRRRSTRKRKRSESVTGSNVTTPVASPSTQTKSLRRSKPPSRLPRRTVKVPSAVGESDTRSTTSDASRTSRASRRKSRPTLTILLPAIHHFHNHNHNHLHRPSPSISESSPRGNPTASQSTTGLVTRSQCRFHKISAPGLVPGTSVFFIVPGCALSAVEVMEEEKMVDCGLASVEDNASKITNVSQLPAKLASVLRKLVGPDLMHEGVCGYLASPALENNGYGTITPPPEDAGLAKGMGKHESGGNGPLTPHSVKSSKTSPGKQPGRKRAPRRSNPGGDLADYVPSSSDADSATDRETNSARHKRNKSTAKRDHTTSSMDPNGFLSLGTAPNADANAVAATEDSAPTIAPKHNSTSPVSARRNQGKKRRRDSDAVAYKPGAESEASSNGEGDASETPRKPKRRRQHLRRPVENVVTGQQEDGQRLSVSVEVPRAVTSSPLSSPRSATQREVSTAPVVDHGACQPRSGVSAPLPKKAQKWWRKLGFGNNRD